MKKTTRIFSILLIAAMLLGAMALTASAAPATKQYDVNGDGGTENAYEIKTADDLLWFAQQVNGGNKGIHGVLMNDIDLSTVCSETLGNWTPIGNHSVPFEGYFDGRGFAVRNLYINDEGASYVGLFGETTKNSLIRNVTVTGTIRANQVIGGIVGKGGGTVRNCVNYANIHATARDVGGIVGAGSGHIYGCVNYGNISADTYYAGGIIGFGYNNTVQDCLNVGKISGRHSYGLGHMNQESCNLSNFLNLGSADTDGVSDKGVTNCYSVSNTSVSGATQIASGDACVTSGELAFLLGGTWGQEIGKDATPIPGGMKVYKTMDPATLCTDTEITYMYANSENTKKSHDTNMPAETYENGFCPICGDYQAAVLNGDTYEISNAGQLYWFAQHVNAGNRYANARLMANITVNQNVLTASGDLNGDPASFRAWIPIASISEYFGGTFHGDGYTVSGLYAKAYGVGFFERITNGGKVYNLGILDSYFENTGYASGAIAGYLAGSGITVENCFSNATIAGNSYISGGLLGNANHYATVKNCFYFGKTVGDPFVYSGFNLNQDKSGNNYYVSTKDDGRPETTAISADILATGELAYLLNGSVNGGAAWGQVIGTDAYPTPVAGENEKVYRTTLCNGDQGYANAEKITEHDPSVTAADRFNKAGRCLVCGTQAAATVNGEYFIDIDTAFAQANATNGATLKLLTNVTLSKVEMKGTFTLDLNGFTLNSADNYQYSLYVTAGHLTIQDSVGTGAILTNAKDSFIGVYNSASFTVTGGTFGKVIANVSGAVTVTGGKFEVLDISGNGTKSISGGEFGTLWCTSTPLENCLVEDYYIYNASGELVDTRAIRRIENVTVRKGADLKYAEIILEYTENPYTALAKMPTVTVTINGRTVAASHYDVSYADNTNIGTATVTVTGKGIYSGENTAAFTITKGSLQVVTNPETTYEFGANYTDVVTGGKVVIVGNESVIIPGTWTWVEAGTTALFTPDAQYEGMFEELTNVSVTHVVTAAAPVIEVITPSPSIMPGMAIRMGVMVKNPHNGELTDLPTAFRVTYRIGENGSPVTVDGLEFTLPTSGLVLGDKVYVTVENVAVDGKYSVATSVNTIELAVGQVDYTAAIEAVQANLDAAKQALQNAIDAKASTEELTQAIEALNKAIENAEKYATEEDAKLKAAIEAADGVLMQAIKQVKTDLQDALDAAVQKLEEADKTNADELEKAIEDLNKAIEDAKKFATDEDVKLKAAIEAADGVLMQAIKQVQQNLNAAVEELKNADKKNDEALAAAIENLNNAIQAAQTAAASGDAAIRSELATAQAALQTAIGAVAQDLANAKQSLENAINTGDNALYETIDKLDSKLSVAIAANAAADKTTKNELTALIQESALVLQTAIDQLAQDLAAAKAELETTIATGDADLNAKVEALTQALADAKAALEKADHTNKTQLTAAIDEASAALNAAMEALSQKLADAQAALEKADADNKAALEKALAATEAALQAKDQQLQNFIIIVCVISGIALCGSAAFVIWFFLDRKKTR